MTDDAGDLTALGMRAVQRAAIEWVRHYHRLVIDVLAQPPDQPVLFVANHGFGGLVDLNVAATYAALQEVRPGRQVTALSHQLAWTLGAGRFIAALGAVPASRHAALDAFDRGQDVLVFPGGDREAARPWLERNQIQFHGRTGFAALALETDVPIVPIVTAGAGNTLLVLSAGRSLARLLGLDGWARSNVLPINIAIPWGLNIGVAGMLPYIGLPARLHTEVLAGLRAHDDEDAGALATRVEDAMQESMDRQVRTVGQVAEDE